jgi:hypothetical protein
VIGWLVRDIYDHLVCNENLYLEDGYDSHASSKKTQGKVATTSIWICQTHVLIACFIAYEKWVRPMLYIIGEVG